jgi:hypothetical protein
MSFNSSSKSSILGREECSVSGMALVRRYSETPIGLFISLRAYSAVTEFLSLQSIIQIEALSSSVFTWLSRAVR